LLDQLQDAYAKEAAARKASNATIKQALDDQILQSLSLKEKLETVIEGSPNAVRRGLSNQFCNQ